MAHHEIIRRTRCCAAALVCVGVFGGCHSMPKTRIDRAVTTIPQSSRDHVHLYLVGSPIDAAELGGLPSMEAHFRRIGFQNTERITWTTPSGLADRIMDDRQHDPDSRTVLVGWSLGCYQILEASSQLEKERQIQVDRVICLDGNPWVGLQGRRNHAPSTSENVVCIYPPHRDLPDGVAKFRQRNVKAAHHFAVPTHAETIETILSELAAVAAADTGAALASSESAAPESSPQGNPPPRFVAEALPARHLAGAKPWQSPREVHPRPRLARNASARRPVPFDQN